MDSPKIAVIGAGVVGLSVAKILQEELRGSDISVIAEQFKDDTTSAVAAGIFRPGPSFRGSTQDITKKWIKDSWHYWVNILKTAEAPQAGVTSLSSYLFSNNSHVTRNHLIEDLVPVYRPVTGEELKICGGDWKYGAYYSTVLIECKRHLPWLEAIITSNGGKMVNKRIDSLSSLRGKYDLVFNCSGMGAEKLCGDLDLVPIRGQVLKVDAPWVKTAFYGDYDTYVIPGFDGVVTLGGTRQYDSYNTEVCKHDTAAIWERCCNLVPGLKRAKVVDQKVGLRPHRTPVRVEPELVEGSKVVHCYGHGGYGVTCAPGTAIDAVKIGLDLLKTNVKYKI
ncbi:D-aspartate oxidase [Eumeta japonica]|uniref:D-aspartate oxidase n=1 Tax=Eumeta variegata TaxID=151549 RepID=A0A4C2A3V0_EUMVA|nr:D-aspartate oxidase [Eumeta japonica]